MGQGNSSTDQCGPKPPDATLETTLTRLEKKFGEWGITMTNMNERKDLDEDDREYILQLMRFVAADLHKEVNSVNKDKIQTTDVKPFNDGQAPRYPIYIYDLLCELKNECTKWTETITTLKGKERNVDKDMKTLCSLLIETEGKLHAYPTRFICLVKDEEAHMKDDKKTNRKPEAGKHGLDVQGKGKGMGHKEGTHNGNVEQAPLKTHANGKNEAVVVTENNGKDPHEEIKQLKKEIAELKKYNDVLKTKCDNIGKTAENDIRIQKGQNEKLETKSLQLQEQMKKMERENITKDQSIKDHQRKIKDTDDKNTVLAMQVDTLKTQWHTERNKCFKLRSENEQLLLRLSKIAGEKLTKDNPAIADLSDRNRPTKLGEKYSELYDNEWTDAFEALRTAGYDEFESINTLKDTLMHTMEFCSQKSTMLRKKTTDAVNLIFDDSNSNVGMDDDKKRMCLTTMPASSGTPNAQGQVPFAFPTAEEMTWRRKWKPKENASKGKIMNRKEKQGHLDVDVKINSMEKQVAEVMVPVVQKVYLENTWDEGCIPAIMPFIKKCLFIEWMMVVQSPPLCLHKEVNPGDNFDTSKYRQYVSSGKYVDFVVWPALLLHESGPTICKGVAEARKAK